MSIEEFDKTTPVTPPNVNNIINPNVHNIEGVYSNNVLPANVLNHLNIFTPVGIAITIVAEVKYARVSTFNPTVNMWWAHTIKPKIPIQHIAYIIPKDPKVSPLLEEYLETTCDTIPNPGKIKIYTSGCPKNQNKCWNSIKSPPPEGSKNDVLRFRSVNNIVIHAASTGKANINNVAVINNDQVNKGINSNSICDTRIFKIVVIMFNDPIIEEAPAKCNEIIAKSTEGSLCPIKLDKGGYTVHPVPTPWLVKLLDKSKNKDGGNNQNLKLFNRGKAISGAPNINGISQFPNPPINIGITAKKIIKKAWDVTTTL